MIFVKPMPKACTKILHQDIKSDTFDHLFNYCSVVGNTNYLDKVSRTVIAYDVHQCTRFSLTLDIATKTTQPIHVNICKEPKIKVSSSTLKNTSNGKSMSILTSLRVTTNILHHLITALKILVQESSSHFLLVPSYGHLN